MDKKSFIEVKIEKIYVQIVRQIEDLIEQCVLKPGDKLPTEPVLAEQLGTSRPPFKRRTKCFGDIGYN